MAENPRALCGQGSAWKFSHHPAFKLSWHGVCDAYLSNPPYVAKEVIARSTVPNKKTL
jgi:hypothetical protein